MPRIFTAQRKSTWSRSVASLAASLLGALSLGGCPSPSVQMSEGRSTRVLFSRCAADLSTRKPDRLKSLTQAQFKNSLAALLPEPIKSDVLSAVEPDLAFVPLEVATSETATRFSRIKGYLGPSDLGTYYRIASSFALQATQPETRLRALVSDCGADFGSDECFKGWIKRAGLLALKRPFADEKAAQYLKDLQVVGTFQEKVQGALIRLILAPQFLYQFDVEGTPDPRNARLIRLDDYALLARISYQLLDAPPDLEMYKWVNEGLLKTDAGIETLIKRITASSRISQMKGVVSKFFEEWLLTNKVLDFDLSNVSFNDFLQPGLPASLGDRGGDLATEMRDEVKDFANYIVFEKKGSLRDLFLDNTSMAKTPNLAAIYGVKPWSEGAPRAQLDASKRAGILTRAAVLASKYPTSNIIQRGVKVRRELLCTEYGMPPARVGGSEDPHDPSGKTLSNREIIERKTSPAACIGCHVTINPPGIALEHFDAIGRYRDDEKVYTEGTAAPIDTLRVDAAVDTAIGDQGTRHFDGALELSQAMAESPLAQRCFARRYYSFTFGVARPDTFDQCNAEALSYQMQTSDAPLDQVMTSIVFSEKFKTFLVGDE